MTKAEKRRYAWNMIVGPLIAIALGVGFIASGDLSPASAEPRKLPLNDGPNWGIPDEPDVDKPTGITLSHDVNSGMASTPIRLGLPVVLVSGRVIFVDLTFFRNSLRVCSAMETHE